MVITRQRGGKTQPEKGQATRSYLSDGLEARRKWFWDCLESLKLCKAKDKARWVNQGQSKKGIIMELTFVLKGIGSYGEW